MKQALAAVTLIYEVCGFQSPAGLPLVVNVKKGIVKLVNKSRKFVERIGMTKFRLMKIFYAWQTIVADVALDLGVSYIQVHW